MIFSNVSPPEKETLNIRNRQMKVKGNSGTNSERQVLLLQGLTTGDHENKTGGQLSGLPFRRLQTEQTQAWRS
jgi:hypothetical protein